MIVKSLKQRFCTHKYKKHWSKKHGTYEYKCVKCGKVR